MAGAKPRYMDASDSSNTEHFTEHATAGRTVRMAKHVHQRWAARLGTVLDPEDDLMDGTGRPDIEEKDLYHPFASKLDWEIARWMVKDGIGHSSFNRLLQIEGVKERLGLSYHNTTGLHQRLNGIPLRAGEWMSKQIYFTDKPDGEPFVLLHRDILDAIRALWGKPELADRIVFKPKQMFSDAEKENRIYTEMWTGEWWWIVQDLLPEGATLASLIVSTDKTQLTQFSGGRVAYPVYLTLGNIPNATRRGTVEARGVCALPAGFPRCDDRSFRASR
ncbi:hypothetical protein CYLTODRAFT_384796 [Cylindrobasidium torrendii FP15055 ss-10]|uniref:Uncharacterized protein n=1 Tax=Cylindrobasidium torrendii FP15055 ss-10 TaxID=1314674 RepID=A0A0D7AT26_9AGAR|nr:hypothetical protein CYLTODRAFT_384796 [Cylindrobasidium torrendii FP15055 ss-10]